MSQCRKFAAIWIFTVAVLSIAGLATFYKKFLQPENPSAGGTSEKLSAGNWSRSNALNGSSTLNRLDNSSSRPTNILTSSTQTVQTPSIQSSGGVSYVQNVTGGEESTTRVNHSEKTNCTATASTSDLVLNAYPVIFNFFINSFGVPLTNNYTHDFPVPHPDTNDNDPQISSSSEKSGLNFRVETLRTSTISEDNIGHELPKSDPSTGEHSSPLSTPDSGNASKTETPQFFIEDQRSESDLHVSTGNGMLANDTSETKIPELPTTDGYSRLTSRNTIDGSRTDSGYWSSSTHTPSISSSKDTSDHGSFPVTGSSSSLESHPNVERYNNILYPIDEFRSSSPAVYTPHSIGTSHSVSSEFGLFTATPEETVASESTVNVSLTYSSTEAMGQTSSTRSSPNTSDQKTMRYLRMEASPSSLQNHYSAPVRVSVTTPHSRFSTNNSPSSYVIENSSPKDHISDHKVSDVPTKLSDPFFSTSKPVVTVSSKTVPQFAAIEINSAGQTENNAATLRSSSVSNPITIPNSSSNLGTRVHAEDPAPTTYPSTNAPTPFQTTITDHSTIKSDGGYSHAYSSSTSYLTNSKSTTTETTANTQPKRSSPPVSTTASTTSEDPEVYEKDNSLEHETINADTGGEVYSDGDGSRSG